MGAKVCRRNNFCRKICIGLLGNVDNAVFRAAVGDCLCLVNVCAALEAPVLVGVKLRFLSQNRHVKHTCAHDHVMRIIFLVHCHHDAVWLRRHL